MQPTHPSTLQDSAIFTKKYTLRHGEMYTAAKMKERNSKVHDFTLPFTAKYKKTQISMA